jgi:hypothetical protein
MIKPLLSIATGLLLFGLQPAAPAKDIPVSLDDKGILIDNGPGAQFRMAWPVLVDTEKQKLKIAEKTVNGSQAVLKFEQGGQIDVAAEAGKITLALSGTLDGIKFVFASLAVDGEYAGNGKWQAGGSGAAFPAAQTTQNLYSGNAKSMAFTSPSGTNTSVTLPPNTFQQLQDMRQWGRKEFYYPFWIAFTPETKTYVIALGDAAPTAPPAAPPPAAAAPAGPAPATEAKPSAITSGGTSLMKWKDGKDAAFMLAFDDSCPSHLKNAIPELEKRKMIGNFYVVTGNDLWTNPARKTEWEAAAKSPYVALQNHTFLHKGAATVEEFDEDVRKCNEAIYAITPHLKNPRMIGFGQPGGVPWKITNEEINGVLAKYHMANRPPFYGPPLSIKSLPECLAVIDTALKKGEMGHLDFHGVGGDWHVTSMEWYTAILDKLDAERNRLWIADVVDWHKYVTERKGAELKETLSNEQEVRVQLGTTADPEWYDLPLTLRSKVPASWTKCSITQGSSQATVPVANGEATYDARPGKEEIVLRAAP